MVSWEQYMKKQKKMNNSKDIETKLGLEFKNKELLERALTHRSYLNEHRGEGIENNERLEFLGDAVLELIISEVLFVNYPEKSEGELTNIRAAAVRTESLAAESRNLGLGEYLKMSKGEEDSGGKDKDYLLANTFESVLGALYLDQGFEVCQQYLTRTLLKKIPTIVEQNLFIDPKTQAQEMIQAQFKVTPLYEVVKEEGPDHDKIFTVALIVNNREIGRGTGSSKQKAEDIVKCAYQKNYTCILTANDINISFSGLTGLVLYYLFLSRIAPNNQDYGNFNIFLAKEGYIDKFAVINSTQFRHSIKEINERVKKEQTNI